MIQEAKVLKKFDEIDRDYVADFLTRACDEAFKLNIDMTVCPVGVGVYDVSVAGANVPLVPERVVPYVVEGMLGVAEANGYIEED